MKVENLTIYNNYNERIIHCFSYDFKDCGLYVLIGNNGSGKTTLLNVLARNELKDYSVDYDHFDVPMENVFFQNVEVLPMNFYEKDILHLLSKVNEQEVNEYTYMRTNRKIATYSEGERRITAIRLLATFPPKLLFLDEFIAHLDKDNLALSKTILQKMANDSIVIMSTNEPHIVELFADVGKVIQL